ncbi:MAG: hypothetical protein PWQ57_1762 [Desulfovibrionales bacterium]|nr:hypothetical protein [Desulfovibrionales bacterium]
MKELLPFFSKPSRYLGSEWGAVRKDPASVKAHTALAFPDMYEVGMSYLGLKILYHAVNRIPGLYAERVFAPSEDVAEVLRERQAPLCSMETDTPLKDMDAVAFSLTHEMAYTNVLYMLDLARIPLRAEQRSEDDPIILAGGGAVLNIEPAAPFFDAVVLGDGEDIFPELVQRLGAARRRGEPRAAKLEELAGLPGVYVPSFYVPVDQGRRVEPAPGRRARIEKAVVEDLNDFDFPSRQILPFHQAVHDRLILEIARGCTRGCRFCHAGMVYRPVRERSLPELDKLLGESLAATGFEELSFLSLSAGDYSDLDGLLAQSFERCAEEQVAISLPSLRVGSVSEEVMRRIAAIRRTGVTIAPEAGSQRLRDVINKGVTEEELVEHVRQLFENGWQLIKLYFMIGLPTETAEDLSAILELCRKVRDAAGPRCKRLQVTASVSLFVPKPHTPFQWEPQIGLEEMQRRIGLLRDMFRREKRIKLKFHDPEMSFLEGVFSRGDRRLAPVIEEAYRRGDLFTAWKDHFQLAPWLEAMQSCGLEPDAFLQRRELDEPLPWDHLDCGVDKAFLLDELARAKDERLTADCRTGACRGCGVCTIGNRKSRLSDQAAVKDIRPRLAPARSAAAPQADAPLLDEAEQREDLGRKAGQYRIWYRKAGPAAYLSQLELARVLERACRRAGLPLSFSKGFHPLPRLSFGRALPVGLTSLCEWVNLTLREDMAPEEIRRALGNQLPEGLEATAVHRLTLSKRQPQPEYETFILTLRASQEKTQDFRRQLLEAGRAASIPVLRRSKRGETTLNAAEMLHSAAEGPAGTVLLTLDWSLNYMNPLSLLQALLPEALPGELELIKTGQYFTLDSAPRPEGR